MQRNALFKFVVMPIAILLLSVGGWYALAKNITGEDDGERKVKVTIRVTEDGKTTETTKEITLEEGQDAEDVLQDMGVFDQLKLKEAKGNIEITVRSTDDDDWSEDHDFRFCFPRGGWTACHDSLTEKKAYLGATLGKEGDKGEGVVMEEVIPGSPAESAGLQNGDIIQSINGTTVDTPEELVDAIRHMKPGDKALIAFSRDGEKEEKEVTLGESSFSAMSFPFPHIEFLDQQLKNMDWDKFGEEMEKNMKDFDWDAFGNQMEDAINEHDWEAFGKDLEEQMRELSESLEDHIGNTAMLGIMGSGEPGENSDGIRIEHVMNGSAAEEMGLKEGDVIASLNGNPVRTMSDLLDGVKSTGAGNEVTIEYLRDGKENTATGVLKSREDMHGMNPSRNHMYMPEDHGHMEDQHHKVRMTIRIEDVTDKDQQKLSSMDGVSAENNLELRSVSLSPNPGDGRFELKFSVPKSGTTTIRMFDASGRRVYDETLHQFKGAYSQVIDISDQPKGIYFLNIEQNGKRFSKKIVKQ